MFTLGFIVGAVLSLAVCWCKVRALEGEVDGLEEKLNKSCTN